MNQKDTVDFGYQQVPLDEKVNKVAEVFHSVANQYDLMNDLMSLGIHRLWKREAIAHAGARKGHCILDLAGGTGDLTRLFHQHIGDSGQIILADINSSMLEQGRNRLLDEGIFKNIHFAQVNAECLPFEENTFDIITIAFGLRNVTDKNAALASMYRVLKPGGRLIVLEFSKPTVQWLAPIYDAYSFSVLPKLGQWITGDSDSYRYLAESIRMHPDQETLKTMICGAGFDACEIHNLTGGIVAIHKAYKY